MQRLLMYHSLREAQRQIETRPDQRLLLTYLGAVSIRAKEAVYYASDST